MSNTDDELLVPRRNPSGIALVYRTTMKRESSKVLTKPLTMDEYDLLYEQTYPYVNSTLKMKKFNHLANEKKLLNLYTKYETDIPLFAYSCSCTIL